MSDFEFTITKTEQIVDLEEYLNYLILERCNEIYYKIISQNNEYQNLQIQLKSCFQELLQTSPEPAHQELIIENLSGIIGSLEMLLPRLVYQQILQDGFRLNAWLAVE